MEDPISGVIMVSGTKEGEKEEEEEEETIVRDRRWREERLLLSHLYPETRSSFSPHHRASSEKVNAMMEKRYDRKEKEDREEETPHQCKESTYGELTHGTLQMILHHPFIHLSDGESFLDLGSGRGATTMQVAISERKLKYSAGVELSKSRHDEACEALSRWQEVVRKKDFLSDAAVATVSPASIVSFQCADMFTVDWTPFDVVYVSALCFRRSMMLEIQRRLIQDLKEGSRIFSLRPFPEEEEEEEKKKHLLFGSLLLVSKSVGRATWGPTNVYIYERVGGFPEKMEKLGPIRKGWGGGGGREIGLTKHSSMCTLKVAH